MLVDTLRGTRLRTAHNRLLTFCYESAPLPRGGVWWRWALHQNRVLDPGAALVHNRSLGLEHQTAELVVGGWNSSNHVLKQS